jgi:hypothetical protein
MNLTNQIAISDSRYDSANGILTYGTGTAEANATFLNGVISGNGQYIDTSSQLSSYYDVLESNTYNSFTYELTLNTEIAKYRNVLLNLLHPTGMQVLGRYGATSNANTNYTITDDISRGHSLSYHTGSSSSFGLMVAPSTEYLFDLGFETEAVTQSYDFGYNTETVTGQLDYNENYDQFIVTNFSSVATNIVRFYELGNTTLSSFVSPNNNILLTTDNGDTVYSSVTAVNDADNYILLSDYVWLTYGNVAVVSGNANTNIINIESLTGTYDYFNNGTYTDPAYPLKDVVQVGDSILVANNPSIIVSGVDYENKFVYLQLNLANTVTSTLMSVGRTFEATNVQIFASV